MSGKKLECRIWSIILAFLLLNTDSIINSSVSLSPYSVSRSIDSTPPIVEEKSVTMLVDTDTGLCLGAHGNFGECGELSMWQWNENDNKVSLQALSTINSGGSKIAGECLGRKRTALGVELKMLPCSKGIFAPIRWTFDTLTGRLADAGLTAKFIGDSCISNGQGILQSCRKGFTSLKRVGLKAHPYSGSGDTGKTGHSQSAKVVNGQVYAEVGNWKCPITGQIFPRNLDKYLSATTALSTGGPLAATRGGSITSSSASSVGRQVFMGSGVLSKTFMGMTFHVFSLAWYVDAAAASRDPTLRAYHGKTLEELQSSEDFYEQLFSSAGVYDRTLFVKLSMTLQTKMLLDGFLAEVVLQPQNRAAVLRASSAYTAAVSPEGLEMVFTWRAGRLGGAAVSDTHTDPSVPTTPSSCSIAHTSDSSIPPTTTTTTTGVQEGGYLEVRIGDALCMELHEPGLAEDFMRQFFAAHKPVSPHAKKGFATFFPALLQG